jgi:hypothetical protein
MQMSKPVNILGTIVIASIAGATTPPVARAQTQITERIVSLSKIALVFCKVSEISDGRAQRIAYLLYAPGSHRPKPHDRIHEQIRQKSGQSTSSHPGRMGFV